MNALISYKWHLFARCSGKSLISYERYWFARCSGKSLTSDEQYWLAKSSGESLIPYELNGTGSLGVRVNPLTS